MRKTPLHAAHVRANARLVDFLGWEMPVQYRGIVEETTRSAGTPGSSTWGTWAGSS